MILEKLRFWHLNLQAEGRELERQTDRQSETKRDTERERWKERETEPDLGLRKSQSPPPAIHFFQQSLTSFFQIAPLPKHYARREHGHSYSNHHNYLNQLWNILHRHICFNIMSLSGDAVWRVCRNSRPWPSKKKRSSVIRIHVFLFLSATPSSQMQTRFKFLVMQTKFFSATMTSLFGWTVHSEIIQFSFFSCQVFYHNYKKCD